ncbi:MAG: response regulator [Planctomycetes bacterium]|nr:response regulator [Planctomycetota bacterium]
MRLEEITPAHVRRAVAIYLEIAWPGVEFPRPRVTVRDLEDAGTLEELFTRFERVQMQEGPLSPRYTLRLGNKRYPFMKFVVQEYLVDREYFFSVDTHDDLDVRADNPDFVAWQALRVHNRELKHQIEDAWAAAGLPTNRDLRRIAEHLAQFEREGKKRHRLLLVDDETDVCRGLGALLEARGYDVELAYDGKAVLERLEQNPLPDLILLDYSMPELDGEEVLARIRGNPRTATLPVLLATASSIDLAHMPRATGFLRKPYPREALFPIISKMLENRTPSAESN